MPLRFVMPATRLLAVAALCLPALARAQDRLKSMPGYEQYTRMAPKLAGAIKSGAINAVWADDGKSFDYMKDGKHWRFDVATKAATEATGAMPMPGGAGRRPGGGAGVARGRQATEAWSKDSAMKAVYKDRNLYIANRDGTGEKQLTTDGSAEKRIKYGTASWVYGEELGQVTAMWWSPDGSRLAYYRFDESPVKDFYLQTGQTSVQGSEMVEAYPKAGTANPIVDLFVYDVASGRDRKSVV